MKESWANTPPQIVQGELTITAVPLPDGRIHLGNGTYLNEWPLSVDVMGLTFSLWGSEQDDEDTTVRYVIE